MNRTALNLEETRAMLRHVAQGMVASKDLLTQADKAIGDGDHGVGMARGFEAVEQKLAGQAFADLGELVRATGTALMTSVGGAAGAVFGSLFRGGAKGLAGRETFGAPELHRLLADGLEAVQARGQAKPGDKTMVDALEPAARAAAQVTGAPLNQALGVAEAAARDGMERTKEMVATVGKAKTLGERSLGHADPGAISLVLILKFMAEFAAGEGTQNDIAR